MSKHVIVVAHCDLCQERGVEEAATVELPSPFTPGTVLDCCEKDAEAVSAATEDLRKVYALGSSVEPPKARRKGQAGQVWSVPTDTSCPYCEYVGPSRGALGTHLKNRHDTSIREARRAGVM